jgi:hypothetical protein
MKHCITLLLVFAFVCLYGVVAQEQMESLNDACFQVDNCPDINCIMNELTYNGADEEPVSSSSGITIFQPYIMIIYIMYMILCVF